jgi:CheY-like chemotaxis protein
MGRESKVADVAGGRGVSTAHRTAPRRILIVDDNEDVRRILSLRLQRAGFEVEDAADGAEGLAAVRRGGWDLVLLDLVMPRVDGFEFLEGLRAANGEVPPVVVVTQYDDTDNRERAMSLGATRYVSKGTAFERRFVGAVQQWLSNPAAA